MLTLARYAVHKSATEYQLHAINTSPIIIFKASVKAHLQYQYKLYKLLLTQYYFPYDWCIREASAKVSNNALVFTL